MSSPEPDPNPPSPDPFNTTHWSVVLRAGDELSPDAASALEKLCRIYWPPLYAYVRHQGHEPTEAQTLTQAFFARLLERNYLTRIRLHHGRFRSFLLALLKDFLAEHRDSAGSRHDTASYIPFPADQLDDEEHRLPNPSDHPNPDQLFERRWAQTLLRHSFQRLEEEYAQAGRSALYQALKDLSITDPASPACSTVARQLGMSSPALQTAAQQLRFRHREILREEIAHTVARPEQVNEEIRHLKAVLARDRS
jgi:DNA-directed RNA polymerase specialized sigma24 family protein